jgi:hypothetical protein
MSFPINPTNGQQTIQNGIAYVYSTATTSWRRTFNNVVDNFFIGASTQSTTTYNGALIVVGGVGIGRNLNVEENVVIYGTTQSTTSDSGALIVKGGAAVGYNLNVAGDIRSNSTTQSNDIDEGALVIDGGVGIAKNLYLGGNFYLQGNAYLNPDGFDISIQPTNGGTAIIYPDNTGSINNMTIGLTEPASSKFTTVQIINTSNSTNSTSGSLVVSGGAGVAKDLYVGGNIYSNGQILGGPWYYTSTNYTAVAGDRLLLDTSSTSITVTLPATPIFGNTIEFIDYSGTFGTNNMTFARNGQRIMGLTENLIINIGFAANSLIYSGPEQGWKIGVIF